MSRAGIDERLADQHSGEPTVASTWEMTAGGEVTVELLDWPPDLFALTNVVLDRSEAFRFALSPVDAWRPPRFSDWPASVEEAGREWGAWVEGRGEALPAMLSEEWIALQEGDHTGLEELARGERREWTRCSDLQAVIARDTDAKPVARHRAPVCVSEVSGGRSGGRAREVLGGRRGRTR
jgi:hypothetical protein